MIDTHSHYNSKDIINLEEEIINHSTLTSIINVGLDIDTSLETVLLSNINEKFYSTIGIHPLKEGNPLDLLDIYNNYSNNKIVGVGEIGLDTTGDIEKQKDKFIQMIEIANIVKLPIIIHSKNSNEEVIKIIKNHKPKYGFVFHCFQPDLDILKQIIQLGGYISVGPPVTRKTAKKSLEVIDIVPIEKLLIETDYPYMTLNPLIDLKNVLDKIVEIKNIDPIILEKQLDNNSKVLFKKLNNK